MVVSMTPKVHNFAIILHNLIYYRCKIHYKGPIIMVIFNEKALLLGYFCLLEDYTLLELLPSENFNYCRYLPLIRSNLDS
jgi:hypothetical protein